jgi:hypothetical protein
VGVWGRCARQAEPRRRRKRLRPGPGPGHTTQPRTPKPNGHDPPQRAAGTRLPHDWTPGDEGTAYAMAELGGDAELVNETWNYFRDYWLARAGAGARKASWPLTWKTWVRKTRDELRERNAREERYRNGRPGR